VTESASVIITALVMHASAENVRVEAKELQ